MTPEPVLTSPDYDGLVFVASKPFNDSTIPEAIREALSQAAKVRNLLNNSVNRKLLEKDCPVTLMMNL